MSGYFESSHRGHGRKTAVVVTNRRNSPTVILRVVAVDPATRHYALIDGTMFTLSFAAEAVTATIGKTSPMTPDEASDFDADFGGWYTS